VSADTYRFSDHSALLNGFGKSFAILNPIPCDILLTPHPVFSNMFQRPKAHDDGKADAFTDPNACRALCRISPGGFGKTSQAGKVKTCPKSRHRDNRLSAVQRL
jgi:hypothetical protein